MLFRWLAKVHQVFAVFPTPQESAKRRRTSNSRPPPHSSRNSQDLDHLVRHARAERPRYHLPTPAAPYPGSTLIGKARCTPRSAEGEFGERITVRPASPGSQQTSPTPGMRTPGIRLGALQLAKPTSWRLRGRSWPPAAESPSWGRDGLETSHSGPEKSVMPLHCGEPLRNLPAICVGCKELLKAPAGVTAQFIVPIRDEWQECSETGRVAGAVPAVITLKVLSHRRQVGGNHR